MSTTTAMWRGRPDSVAAPEVDTERGTPTPPPRRRSTKSLDQFTYLATLCVGAFIALGTAGAVIGWVRLFADDNTYARRMGDLANEDARIQMLLDTEKSIREASDAHVLAVQNALAQDISPEIANRTLQDMQLMSLLTAEVAAREAFQDLLRRLLADEIAYRLGNDTIIDGQLTGLEARLSSLSAYDAYVLQQFMIKMDNLTHIDERLAQEIADRLASDATLSAQDAAQVAAIASLGPAIASERVTRVAFDDYVMSILMPLVSGGVVSINNQPGVQNNFNFNAAAGCAFTVGSGGGHVITLSSNAVITLAGMSPNPATGDVGLVGEGNVLVTPNPMTNSITVGLQTVVIPANSAVYVGSISGLFPMISNNWIFDFAGNGGFITNYGTYNGLGWEVPLLGGVGVGIWLVEIKFVMTMQFAITPLTTPLTVAACTGTFSFCAANPQANAPMKTYRYSDGHGQTQSTLQTWGLEYQDIAFDFMMVFDGRNLPAGTGVYPVWRSERNPDGGQTAPSARALSVVYQVSQIF